MTIGGPETRLATYGTLAPGRVNAHQLDALDGTWTQGTVRGILYAAGWGPDMGYSGITLDPAGDAVPVHLFTSQDLPEHWSRLDAFEGSGYVRVPVSVETDAGAVVAYVYALAEGN